MGRPVKGRGSQKTTKRLCADREPDGKRLPSSMKKGAFLFFSFDFHLIEEEPL
jgi:hypothetical protein